MISMNGEKGNKEMNLMNRTLIEKIVQSCSQYKNKVTEVCDDYSKRAATARAESRVYKNEDEHYESAKRILAEKARNALKAARTLFAEEIRTSSEQLTAEMRKHLAEPCNSNALALIKTWKDFSIVPSKTEIETVLDLIRGNTTGLAALSNVLTQNKAPYTVNYRGIEAYERDLEIINNLPNLAAGFVPNECHSAACDIYRGQQIPRFRADGSSYTDGSTWDSLSLIIQRSSFTEAVRKIEAAKDSWTADVSYEIADAHAEEVEQAAEEDLADVIPEPISATSLTDNQTDPVEMARDRGREAAKQEATAASTLREYSK